MEQSPEAEEVAMASMIGRGETITTRGRLAPELPLPPHVDAAHAADWNYSPDQQALFAAATQWRRAHDIPRASASDPNVHLLVVDAQKDFCFPRGTLYVGGRSGRGAVEDNERLAAFIYRNLGTITRLTTTMDTHLAYQIFFAPFWLDRDGASLQPHTVITTDDIRSGHARPDPDLAWWLCDGDNDWLRRQVEYYCAELERGGRYELYLWPPHCILGSDGHALAGVIHEARMFHSFVRGVQSWSEIKGTNPLTENYSVLRPEVLTTFDGRLLAHKNEAFIATLLSADMVVVAGEASSHCVRSSVEDLLEEIVARDPALARKVYLLGDCMSAVTVPDGKGGFVADFTEQAMAAERRFVAAGMRVVRSTDPIASWPGIAISH